MRLTDGSELVFPDDFFEIEEFYEAKGVVVLELFDILGRRYMLTFLEKTRLIQELGDLGEEGYFQSNLIIVESVNIHHILPPVNSLLKRRMDGVFASPNHSSPPS
jgi:hypothetical protein